MLDLTEATPLSSPDTSDTTGSDIYDKMQGDAGYTRGDISPGEMEMGEGSGTDFTDIYTYTSGFESTFEGSGTNEVTENGELFGMEFGITETGVTEEIESTMDSTDESTVESMTESDGELM